MGSCSVIPATLSVVARFGRAGSVERQQIKWLLAATSLLAVAYLVGAMSDDSNDAVWWVVSIAVAAIPISILFAVLRYRLYDIDRILSRTVSYVIVIGLLAGVYLLGLTAMTNFLPSDSSLSVAASTLAVAALFNPLRRRVQAGVERRFNRSRYDAQQVMERFSGSLRQDVDPDTVVRAGWGWYRRRCTRHRSRCGFVTISGRWRDRNGAMVQLMRRRRAEEETPVADETQIPESKTRLIEAIPIPLGIRWRRFSCPRAGQLCCATSNWSRRQWTRSGKPVWSSSCR